MAEVLLEELIDSDIDWMTQAGRKQQVATHQFLIQQNDVPEAFYVVLEGALVATIQSDQSNTLGRAYAAILDNPSTRQDVLRFEIGEVVGETVFLTKAPSSIAVQAVEPSSVLVLPYEQLQAHFERDVEFAARFYRAIAILLLKRFEYLLETFSHRKGLQIPPLQDGPLLFGELSDRDVDWMIEHAVVQDVIPGEELVQAGRMLEKLYIVLEGMLSIAIVEGQKSRMASIFDRIQGSEAVVGREIARVAKGEIFGETALLTTRLSNYTIQAIEPSTLLVLSTQQMALKLQQDPAMASRFYRVLSILLSQRLEGLISRLGYGQNTYQAGALLSESVRYEDEIDLELLDGLTLGGARFDWMLRQLNVRGMR
ncbi:cyclic nucleotide-binding domain-containing protein [Leptolyngbya boryana CZ1]|uniref:Cyclic nucleotide-binding domain-containing protein n=1 Tax=Leptolyngbya boryana CZ1 TaxID=3060204 RepID=A0AA97AM86_LEPBY|nr:cyclic nucleotide-binding domain-containing protein [Leptolyngbya boryana]WNZ43927.1 cyclic nucleotide-binding domain-containing protein [Leptolyngbya boryana CZ1]